MLNPTLSDLVGGIQTVTLGDEEARRRGTQKTVLERKAPPTFDIMVEILDRERVAVHRDVAEMVDSLLRGEVIPPEIRTRLSNGTIHTEVAHIPPFRSNGGMSGPSHRRGGESGRGRGYGYEERPIAPRRQMPAPQSPAMRSERGKRVWQSGGSQGIRAEGGNGGGARPFADERVDYAYDGGAEEEYEEQQQELEQEVSPRSARSGMGMMSVAAKASPNKPLSIYPFGVSRNRLENAIKMMRVPAQLVREMSGADIVMTLKNYYRKSPQQLRQAEANGVPVFVLKSNTQLQIDAALGNVFNVPAPPADPMNDAMEEAEAAISHVLETARPVELAPQASYIRRLQHQMAERYNLGSTSKGKEPFRRVRIYRQD
jgi:hypothetical protein